MAMIKYGFAYEGSQTLKTAARVLLLIGFWISVAVVSMLSLIILICAV